MGCFSAEIIMQIVEIIVQVVKRLIYSTVITFAVAGLLLVVVSSPAHAQAGCDIKDLGSADATANLSFTAPHTDEADWSSTITFAIPTSWPRAYDLLDDIDSGAFLTAYSCVVPAGSAGDQAGA
jgi:hypothetical protein